MKKYFTSDWHLGDDRIGVNGKPNLFYRPFESVFDQDVSIVQNFLKSGFQDGDELWHLGDVFCKFTPLNMELMNSIRASFPKSKFNLIIGNYDEDKLDYLNAWFNVMQHESVVTVWKENIYLNHYPSKANNNKYVFPAITGHIHGLWKVQEHMINVGVDAWHFKPVSEKEISFCFNAIYNHYDENVFPKKS